MPSERRRHLSNPPSGAAFETRRTGLSSFLFAILRPRDAKSASVNDETVRLVLGKWPVIVPLRDLEEVEVTDGLVWSRLRVRYNSGSATVSGLSRKAAAALADAVETARHDWWQRLLAFLVETLKPVHGRIAALSDPPKYFTVAEMRELELEAQNATCQVTGRWPKELADAPGIQMLRDTLTFLEDPEEARSKANEIYIANELIRSRELLDTIEARPLTEEQRKAVVIDEQRNLVIAAAGSGKTSVIVAKAAWLLQRAHGNPSELLLLAFARDARNEMKERIHARLGAATASHITVSTFHSLGMGIIGKAEGKRPSLSPAAESQTGLFELLKSIVADLFTDSKLSKILREWFQGEFAPYASPHEFKCWGEYWDYIRKFNICSLQGETVKSMEECEIANFLYLNGIEYKYEAPYKHETATSEKRQYQPDFYLPEYGIYIEHFGIDANGKTASFVDQEKYLRDMDWKREQHTKNETTLIETFSHEIADGKLLRNLTNKLAAHGVALSPIPQEKVFEILQKQERLDPFTRLVATFLQHFKGSRLSLSEIARQAVKHRHPARASAFLAVFGPIFERYQETLTNSEEIDFHDMINRATDLVETGRFRSRFKYILVDEFQDISPSRAALLKALLDNCPGARLFAVGDDWQAIFRFAGSDIAVMQEFEERFGDYERIFLETTFRCSDHIAEVATEFVLRNPAQINKTVRARNKAERPAVQIGLPGEKGLSLLKEALDRIANDASLLGETSEVLLLGRYKHLRPRHMATLSSQYPNLRFSWRTIHGSKGLEADYAVVLGVCTGKYAFPSEVDDDPLLNLVLAAPDAHPNAEERRLLYVALTRARRQVFLLADGGAPSSFVSELTGRGYEVGVFGREPEADVFCPRCVKGRLLRRENEKNKSFFYGCSNYPLCKHIARACPKCGSGLPVKTDDAWRCRGCDVNIEGCPACGEWLEERMGKFGRFYGCSNWPECGYTRNLREQQSGQSST
ncbi:MAG: UvrD-helicase domain-containing protein [Halieaceae bacterium]|nr:UvrD-helicase domain-containing protein [Halieaceae bacterium]